MKTLKNKLFHPDNSPSENKNKNMESRNTGVQINKRNEHLIMAMDKLNGLMKQLVICAGNDPVRAERIRQDIKRWNIIATESVAF